VAVAHARPRSRDAAPAMLRPLQSQTDAVPLGLLTRLLQAQASLLHELHPALL